VLEVNGAVEFTPACSLPHGDVFAEVAWAAAAAGGAVEAVDAGG
jgi:hypothetical protein